MTHMTNTNAITTLAIEPELIRNSAQLPVGICVGRHIGQRTTISNSSLPTSGLIISGTVKFMMPSFWP
jgi:hypothetical protein